MLASNDGATGKRSLLIDDVTILNGSIKIKRSIDCYSYLLWWAPDGYNEFLKVAPTCGCKSEDDYLAILEHQSWVCI